MFLNGYNIFSTKLFKRFDLTDIHWHKFNKSDNAELSITTSFAEQNWVKLSTDCLPSRQFFRELEAISDLIK